MDIISPIKYYSTNFKYKNEEIYFSLFKDRTLIVYNTANNLNVTNVFFKLSDKDETDKLKQELLKEFPNSFFYCLKYGFNMFELNIDLSKDDLFFFKLKYKKEN